MPSPFDDHDALGLADLVRRGEVRSRELIEDAIRRVEGVNDALNAVTTPLYAWAREVAAAYDRDLGDGPFAGVPFALKDLNAALAGVPLTSGSAALRRYVPDRDSALVARQRAAGLVPVAKTTTPELGLMGVTEPEAFGPTRNPWNLDRTPGGSSGGSAALVAARALPAAHANDGGGSIRIPAAYCGLFGLKPTRGRVPAGPYAGEWWDGASVDHAVTLTVRDSAALLDVTRGPDLGAPLAIPPPERPYLDEVRRDPGRLRIGFTRRSPIGTPVEAACVRAVEDAAALLEGLGHDVEEADPEIDGAGLVDSYLTMYVGQTAADLRWIADTFGARAPKEMELATRALALIGEHYSAADYVVARRRWNDFARAMGTFHQTYDLWLTPTVAALPARIGATQPSTAEVFQLETAVRLRAGGLLVAGGMVEEIANEHLARTPFTQLANLTGQPAMSVPLWWSGEGLPCGVQFVAPFGDEAALFRLAAQLEAERPWRDRRPPLAASA
jgi:amidase